MRDIVSYGAKEPGNTTRNQKDCSRAERQLLFMEMLTAIAVVAMKTNDAEKKIKQHGANKPATIAENHLE